MATVCPDVSSWSDRRGWPRSAGWRLVLPAPPRSSGDSARGGGGGDLPLPTHGQPASRCPTTGSRRWRAGREPETRHAAGPQLPRVHQPGHASPRSRRRIGATIEILHVYDTEDSCSPKLAQRVAHVRPGHGRDDAQAARATCVGKLIQPLNQEYLPNFTNVLAALQRPVLRRRLEVHGAVHRLHDRHRLPARRDRRRGRSPATTAGRCCGIPPTRASSGSSTTPARRSRSACTTAASRHQHR